MAEQNEHKFVSLIGSASGLAAADAGCADGPMVLCRSSLFADMLKNESVAYEWKKILSTKISEKDKKLPIISRHCRDLAELIADTVQKKEFFAVLGGDHSCACGTWSGVYQGACQGKGDLGLIWIDAHMDSHVEETSPSGNIHGMPLACLLGYGWPDLTQIMSAESKLKPEHVCVIGVRSYESGEQELLEKLNVRIFYMDEVKSRGLAVVLAEARDIVHEGTVGYGISIDVDAIDPEDAPGTGTREPDGISGDDLCMALGMFAHDEALFGVEIVEFDPHKDKNQMTEKLIGKMLVALV